jgi:hypothetical protein
MSEHDHEFEGLTPMGCCSACQAGVCIITREGTGFCAHPMRAGALQGADQMVPAIVARRERARKLLAAAMA